MSSALDVIDVVDMLEKKHNFTREDAKMLIDFQQSRVVTKEDLKLTEIKLGAKIDFVKQELDFKVEKEVASVRSDLKEEIAKSNLENQKTAKSNLMWTFGMFVTFFGLNAGFVYFLLRTVVISQ